VIYTDGVHLVSDCGVEDLHYFAKKIGLRREWFQDHKRHPHYDMLSPVILRRAIDKGAAVVSTRGLVKLRAIREQSIGCDTCQYCSRP